MVNNQLNWLNGNGNATNFGPPQSANNYTYDPIGNLITDNQAQISNVNWSVYNKIQSITDSGKTISYLYNTAQERVTKTANSLTTYYVRDAQGNTIAVYDNKAGQINWREQHLYGSDRIGMWQPNMNVANNQAPQITDTVGHLRYEGKNHLGNVIVTMTDKRLPYPATGTPSYYLPDITTAQDYYAYGAQMPGRTYTANANYRYGFNGKENDNEVKGVGNQQDYGMRITDNRAGRFLSVDPITAKYPELTPYQFASNSPIANIDMDGKENLYFQINHDQKTGKAIIKKEVTHFPLEKIMPYNVFFNIDNSGYYYQASYFEGQRKQLNQIIANYAKNPKEAIEYLKSSKAAQDKRNAEDDEFWKNIWVDGYTTAWAVNRTNQPIEARSPIVEPEINPMSNVQEQAKTSTGITVTNNGESVAIYRGGNSFELKPNEYRVTPTGPYPARGLSLDINLDNAARREGGAYRIISIPKDLEIIATPNRNNPGHFDIIPKDRSISESKFQELLNQIKTEPVKPKTN